MQSPAQSPARFFILPALLALLGLPAWAGAQGIPSPEEFFGHRMGADRELAHWDELSE